MNDNRLNQLYPENFSGSRNDLSFGNPCRWRLKEITAGDMHIIKLYPVRADYTQPKKFYSKPTRDAQQKLNLKNSADRFRLLFLANFCSDSLYVTLTFAKEPRDKDKALEKYKYFIKKLKKPQQVRLNISESLKHSVRMGRTQEFIFTQLFRE